MVREDVPFRRDYRTAARCLALQFPAFLVRIRDDVNADEARRDLRQRGLNVRLRRGGLPGGTGDRESQPCQYRDEPSHVPADVTINESSVRASPRQTVSADSARRAAGTWRSSACRRSARCRARARARRRRPACRQASGRGAPTRRRAADDGRRDTSERDANVANGLAVEIRRRRKADLRNRLRLTRADLSVRLYHEPRPRGSVMLLMISSGFKSMALYPK